MPLSAFSLIVLAGLIHAGWNIVAKKAGGDARFAFFTAFLMMCLWAPLGWWVGRDAVPLWGAIEWGFVAASGVLHVVYFVVLLRGYRKADLTVVYPLARGSGPLLSSLVAIVFLGEQISILGVAGIAGVVGGVFLIAGGPGLLRAARDPVARQRVHTGMAYGLLTGAFIASYTVVDGYAVKWLLMSPILVDYMGNFVRVALLAPTVLRDHATARPSSPCWVATSPAHPRAASRSRLRWGGLIAVGSCCSRWKPGPAWTPGPRASRKATAHLGWVALTCRLACRASWSPHWAGPPTGWPACAISPA